MGNVYIYTRNCACRRHWWRVGRYAGMRPALNVFRRRRRRQPRAQFLLVSVCAPSDERGKKIANSDSATRRRYWEKNTHSGWTGGKDWIVKIISSNTHSTLIIFGRRSNDIYEQFSMSSRLAPAPTDVWKNIASIKISLTTRVIVFYKKIICSKIIILARMSTPFI